ncbi:MAG: hypothetical protein HND46_22705 [Chloroflexi bacterium]|nr:hypothetical protein [Chloroflexota bacterium]NOG66233.1 hypothetical protein [Chloroflexota bacterium]GIK40605.1 MAG: hypothetical protein BroJett011_44380 [Chloroflexota bacterium]
MQDPKALFDIWFVQPLKSLEAIPNGAGAFIALATSCFLYERYADAAIREAGSQYTVEKQLMIDFNISEETAREFWTIMRNGILHKGMPKKKDRGKNLSGWRFEGEFTQAIKLDKTNGSFQELQVQPWLFMNKVIELWQDNIDLIDRNESFPWARIVD